MTEDEFDPFPHLFGFFQHQLMLPLGRTVWPNAKKSTKPEAGTALFAQSATLHLKLRSIACAFRSHLPAGATSLKGENGTPEHIQKA